MASLIKLAFQFDKREDEVYVVMVKHAIGNSWYLIPNKFRSANHHPLLHDLIQSIAFDESGSAIGHFDLPARYKEIYINTSNLFRFKNILAPARDTFKGVNLECLNLLDDELKINKCKLSNSSLNSSFNTYCNDSNIHHSSFNQQTNKVSTGDQQTFVSFSVPTTDQPTKITTNPIAKLIPPPTTTMNPMNITNNPPASGLNEAPSIPLLNNSSNNDSANNNELEPFDMEVHNVNDYIERFEKKNQDIKSRKKFHEFVKLMPTEELKKKVMTASTKSTWKSFIESFAQDLSDRHHNLIKNKINSKLEKGRDDLVEFVEKKFELFDKILNEIPQNMQILLIIASLPDEYSKPRFLNLDDNRADFIEKIKYNFYNPDDEEEIENITEERNQPVDQINPVQNTPSVSNSTDVPSNPVITPTASNPIVVTTPTTIPMADVSNSNNDASNSVSNRDQMEVEQTVLLSNGNCLSQGEENMQVAIDCPLTPPYSQSNSESNSEPSSHSRTENQISNNITSIGTQQASIPLSGLTDEQSSSSANSRPSDQQIPRVEVIRREETYELITIPDSDEEDSNIDQIEVTRFRARFPNHLYSKQPKLEPQ